VNIKARVINFTSIENKDYILRDAKYEKISLCRERDLRLLSFILLLKGRWLGWRGENIA